MAAFYVSATGNDSNTGLNETSSFQTLERALQAMQQSNGADTVYLAGGTYHIDDALPLSAADSGSSFQALSGQQVVISGGTPVTGWSKGADGIWTAHVDADQVQQLTVHGVKQTESRFPDVDPNDPVKGGWLWGQDLPSGHDPQTSLAFNPSDFPAGHAPQVGQTVTVFSENGYANDKLTIASVQGNVITFTSEANYDLGPASRYYISEATPDNVGEWSYDSASQTVRYRAPEGFTGEGAVASGDHSLFVVDGAKDVSFKGLTFADTTAKAGDPETAAIEAHDATGLKVEGNHFLNVGVGVALHGGSSGNLIAGNRFEHTWSSAIALTPGTSGNHITNNVIDRSNEAFVQHGSISMEESAGNQIDHNTITNVPRFGIAEINYDPGNASGGNTIEYNDIRHSGQQTPDVGAIYLFSADDAGAAGDVIRYNNIVDTGGLNTTDGGFAENWSSGIYLDNMASNAQIYGNFVQGTTFSGILIHGGSNNQIHDNTLIDNGKYGISTIVADDNPITGNQTYGNFIEVSEDGSNTIDTDQTDPGLIRDNVYYNPDGRELTVADVSLAGFQQRGGDTGSVVTSQAGFADAAAGDYSFTSGSTAQSHGIESAPFGSIGASLAGSFPEIGTPATPPVEGSAPPVAPQPQDPAPETPPAVEPQEPSAVETPPITAQPNLPQTETPVSDPGSGSDVITIPEVTPLPEAEPDTPSNGGFWSGWGGHGWGGRDWLRDILAQRDHDDGGARNWFENARGRQDDSDIRGGGRNCWQDIQSHQDAGDDGQHHQQAHWHW